MFNVHSHEIAIAPKRLSDNFFVLFFSFICATKNIIKKYEKNIRAESHRDRMKNEDEAHK